MIVCLVGRRRDWKLLRDAEVYETLKGNIVLTVGCIGPDGPHVFHDEEATRKCKELHFKKIEMADEVLCVSKEFGADTFQDINHAVRNGKGVRFLQDEETVGENGRLVCISRYNVHGA